MKTFISPALNALRNEPRQGTQKEKPAGGKGNRK